MKKLLALLLGLALCLTGTAAYADSGEGETLTAGVYQYILLEDGSAKITRYRGEDKNLTLPEELDGHAVTAIGNGAFAASVSLHTLTIPEGVTVIGNGAFMECISLHTVTIPDSVAAIGANPFYLCTKLRTIQLSSEHEALAVVEGVLFSKADGRLVCYPGALSAENYTIPEGTLSVGDSAFSGCGRLRTVAIPEGVTAIGDNAFSNCKRLNTLTIPDSVTAIGSGAFEGCKKLTLALGENPTVKDYCAANDLPYTE